MKIQYETTIEDIVAFNEYAWRTSPALRRQYLRGFVASPITGLLSAAAFRWFAPSSPLWVAGVVFLIAAAAFVPLYQTQVIRSLRRTVRAAMREGKNGGIVGRHEIELTPDELSHSTGVGESRHKWSGIERVDTTPDYLFIFTQSVAAHVVPRRAFPSPRDAIAFSEEAIRLWKRAQSADPGTSRPLGRH